MKWTPELGLVVGICLMVLVVVTVVLLAGDPPCGREIAVTCAGAR